MSISKFNEIVKSEIITDTGEILEDRTESGRKRDWVSKKKMNLKMFDLYQRAFTIEPIISESRLQQLYDCGSQLIFSNEVGSDKRKLAMANFCRVRLCPMCNWRKSLKLYIQMSKVTDRIIAENKVRFIFVTLTVRNPKAKGLGDVLDKMNQAFSYLVNKNRRFLLADKLKQNLKGYMKATEITYNSKDDTYHPHYHCLFAVRPSYFDSGYLKQKDWVQLWKGAMKLDYEPVIDVRTIKNTTGKAIAEVSKYPVKSADLLKVANQEQAVSALITLHNSMKNRRLVTFGGLFKDYRAKLKLDDVENGDLVHVEIDKQELNSVAYTLFRYNVSVGAYIC